MAYTDLRAIAFSAHLLLGTLTHHYISYNSVAPEPAGLSPYLQQPADEYISHT
jgi:hypothetical protein